MRGPPSHPTDGRDARIAHDRHPPEAKDHMSADVPLCDRPVKKRTYPLVSGSDDERYRRRGAWRDLRLSA
jgi:hypothetical protein